MYSGKPSQLANQLSQIVAEECGCPAAWDISRTGQSIREVSAAQLLNIKLRINQALLGLETVPPQKFYSVGK